MQEYVIVLLRNGRRKAEAAQELHVFLGDDNLSFVAWLPVLSCPILFILFFSPLIHPHSPLILSHSPLILSHSYSINM